MLAIGRALMARPALLLLDEPSLGIAPQAGAADIFAAIRSGRPSAGTTILLVEQNTRVALEYSEREPTCSALARLR
jgi:branched-chain amino acid transport system ATP-binding protein